MWFAFATGAAIKLRLLEQALRLLHGGSGADGLKVRARLCRWHSGGECYAAAARHLQCATRADPFFFSKPVQYFELQTNSMVGLILKLSDTVTLTRTFTARKKVRPVIGFFHRMSPKQFFINLHTILKEH